MINGILVHPTASGVLKNITIEISLIQTLQMILLMYNIQNGEIQKVDPPLQGAGRIPSVYFPLG